MNCPSSGSLPRRHVTISAWNSGCSVDHISTAREIGTPIADRRLQTPSNISTMSGSPSAWSINHSLICEIKLKSAIAPIPLNERSKHQFQPRPRDDRAGEADLRLRLDRSQTRIIASRAVVENEQ